MERMLEGMVIFVAKIHNYILSLNDAYEKNFTDKQLHFLVIGILGMLILMVIYPLFKLLSENHILAIAFIYVFTVIVVITFAIEIGQKISDSGTMDFADIVFGNCRIFADVCDFCCYKTNFSGNYQFVPKNRKTLERV